MPVFSHNYLETLNRARKSPILLTFHHFKNSANQSPCSHEIFPLVAQPSKLSLQTPERPQLLRGRISNIPKRFRPRPPRKPCPNYISSHRFARKVSEASWDMAGNPRRIAWDCCSTTRLILESEVDDSTVMYTLLETSVIKPCWNVVVGMRTHYIEMHAT